MADRVGPNHFIIADVKDCGYSVWLLERKNGAAGANVWRINQSGRSESAGDGLLKVRNSALSASSPTVISPRVAR